jgi:hypothetical protein
MKKENKMQKEITVKVELNAQQIALLLQILDEQISIGNMVSSDNALAFGVLEILETAENTAYSHLHYFS